jgi:hypothetical protein
MEPPTDRVKTIWETALADISKLIEQHMIHVAREWQKQFPKRQVRFMDAMGVAGFLIDGEWVEIPQKYAHLHPQGTNFDTWNYSSGEQHKHFLLMPLFDAMEWYATMMDECDDMISVEFTLERLK